MKILVIAAHPDDEVLGMGATIKKLSSRGNTINLCVVSEGTTAQYSDEKMIEVRKNACLKAAEILGISTVDFLEYPDMRLDTVSHLEINRSLEKIIRKYKPKIIYTLSQNDLNKDHRIVHESTLIAARPTSSNVKKIIAYEIPGHRMEPFNPNIYEDISKELPTKIRAFKTYKTELEKFPHPRSLETIRSLANLRGMESGLKKAESFQLIRSIES